MNNLSEMKKIFILLISLFTFTITHGQIPTYTWAYSIGDVSQEYLDALVTDNENNVIIGGQMYSTTDMDPTEFSEILYQIGQQDAFIEKMAADGSYVLWGINFGGPNYDGVVKLAVDDSDNIYAIGYFQLTADFDPNIVDVHNLTSNGGYDMFLAKYNKDGEFVWAHGMGDVEDDWINNIVIDEEQNIYVTGQFIGTVDFDGTEGVLEINSTLDKYDGFLAKYNTDGEISWVFRMGGFYEDIANEVAVDKEGNIIVTGTFQGTADFDGTFLTAAGGTMIGWPEEGDAYIAKYNSDADLIWVKGIRGDAEFNGGYSNSVISLALDQDDNIYVTGLIYGEGDFDVNDGEYVIETFDSYDSYFAKYSSDGNLIWAHVIAPKVFGFNLDMVIDANNDIYLTGDFNYSTGIPYEADFDVSDDNIFELQAVGEKDVYIAKYDSSSALLWAYSIGGSGWEFSTAISLDNNYDLCVGGWFYSTDDFDANPDSNFIWLPYTNPLYGNNIWVGKYHQDSIEIPVTVENSYFENAFFLYPNPAHENFTINFNSDLKDAMIEIYNAMGEKIYSDSINDKEKTVSTITFSAGIYYVIIVAGETCYKKKLIIE